MNLTEFMQQRGMMEGMMPPPQMGGAVPNAPYMTPQQLELMMGMGAPAPAAPQMPMPPMEAPPTEAPVTSYQPMETPAAGSRPPLPGNLGADQFFADYAAKWNPEQEVNPMTALMDRLGQKTPTTPPRQVGGVPMGQQMPGSVGGFGNAGMTGKRMVMPAPSQGERRLRSSGYGRPVERLNWLRGLQSSRGY